MEFEPKFLRHLRRRANQVFARWRPQPARFVYGSQYQFAWSGVPFDEIRGERILTALAVEGLVARDYIRQPPLASYHAILRVHTDAYLEALQTPSAIERIFGSAVGERDSQRLLDLQRSMAGGTMLATDIALSTGNIAINLGGGFHHAHPDVGRGFCMFNDVAIAIAEQRDLGFRGKVLVIDLDLHDGDGTRAIFASDTTVHTLSIHNHHWGPTAALESTSVELGDNVGDATYLDAVRQHVTALLRQFRPQLVYFVAGVDPAHDDALGNWTLSDDTMLARDEAVFELVRHLAPDAALVVVLAGGYGPSAWRHSARSFAWLQSGHHGFRPPANDEIVLMRARHLARLLDPRELTGQPSGDDLGLTLEDLVPSMGRSAQETRLLGYYSRQGLEFALDRQGYLGRLRAKGFKTPTLVTNFDDVTRQSITIYGDPDRSEKLVELVLHRDRRTISGFELLAIDWMLLQNPREKFDERRPKLPGQEHPGLGLFDELVALLIVACERVGLAGLVVTPSQYHLAVQWTRRLRFAEPRDGARLRALREALGPTPLAEVDAVLRAGRVVDRTTGAPVAYVPAPMVLPLSPELQAALRMEDYPRAMDDAADEFQFELRPA
jgi:acetoin utilization deacetylase AcuC-like enzyme